MGLDMYLYKKHYIGNKYREPGEMVTVNVPEKQDKSVFPTRKIKSERISEITEQVAYWRKANAIHKWFAENVQDGEDDCKEYYVDLAKLKDLCSLCKTVLAASHLVDGKIQNGQHYKDGVWVPILEEGKTVKDSTSAEILLPTTKGFFFGSTDYDQYYVDDLKNTVEQLDVIIEEGGEFYYQSSW